MKAAKIIREYYQMNKDPTEDEVEKEIANLIRRRKKCSLDNRGEAMYASLFIQTDLFFCPAHGKRPGDKVCPGVNCNGKSENCI